MSEAETEDLAIHPDGLHEPIAAAPTGSMLVDGLRTGLAARGLTAADVLHSAVLPAHVIEPILSWHPGRAMPEPIAWALVIDAIASQGGLCITCLPRRRSTVGLEVVLRSLLDRSGISWEAMIRRVASGIPSGLTMMTWELRGAGLPCLALDHVAFLAVVAPVLIPAAPSSAN